METAEFQLTYVIRTTKLMALDSKRTDQCFAPPRCKQRHLDMVNLLPEFQPETDPCTISTLGLMGSATFFKYAVGLLGAPASSSIKTIEALLKDRGYPLLLTHFDQMVVRTDAKLNTDMRTNGIPNFCFLENKDGSISMGFAHYKYRIGWYVGIVAFDDARYLTRAHRFLVRNYVL